MWKVSIGRHSDWIEHPFQTVATTACTVTPPTGGKPRTVLASRELWPARPERRPAPARWHPAAQLGRDRLLAVPFVLGHGAVTGRATARRRAAGHPAAPFPRRPPRLLVSLPRRAAASCRRAAPRR